MRVWVKLALLPVWALGVGLSSAMLYDAIQRKRRTLAALKRLREARRRAIDGSHLRLANMMRLEASVLGGCGCRVCGRNAVGGEVVTVSGGEGSRIKLRGFAACRACLDAPDGRWRVENLAAHDVGAGLGPADTRFASF